MPGFSTLRNIIKLGWRACLRGPSTPAVQLAPPVARTLATSAPASARLLESFSPLPHLVRHELQQLQRFRSSGLALGELSALPSPSRHVAPGIAPPPSRAASFTDADAALHAYCSSSAASARGPRENDDISQHRIHDHESRCHVPLADEDAFRADLDALLGPCSHACEAAHPSMTHSAYAAAKHSAKFTAADEDAFREYCASKMGGARAAAAPAPRSAADDAELLAQFLHDTKDKR